MNFNRLLFRELDNLFKKYLPINKNFKSLEIGCSSDLWMWYFNKLFEYKTSAIDILNSSLLVVDNVLKQYKMSNYKLICKDVFDYERKDYFDFVYSLSTIEHLKNPHNFFIKCYSLLKKNGYLLIEVPNFSRINKLIMKFFQDKKDYESYLSMHNLNILSLNFLTKILFYCYFFV